MLVLSRKVNESLVIGKDVEIKVLGIEDGKVKIGIEAPRSMDIYRKEIYVEIEEENISAGKQKIDINNLKNLFKQK